MRRDCATVVSRGIWKAALAMSSKPITEISLGHCRPTSANARNAPIAARSLKQKIAESHEFSTEAGAQEYPSSGEEAWSAR
jgi:hypothetical protein